MVKGTVVFSKPTVVNIKETKFSILYSPGDLIRWVLLRPQQMRERGSN